MGGEPVIEEKQLEIFSADGDSIAEEGGASFFSRLFCLQDVEIFAHLEHTFSLGTEYNSQYCVYHSSSIFVHNLEQEINCILLNLFGIKALSLSSL